MFYGKIAKLTFSALLLAAAGSAYAQDVTLNDGTTKVSWSEFIKAINDPTSIKGTVSEAVQKTYDDAKAAYDKVVENYNAKVAAQTSAQTNYNAAVKTQSEKATALRTATADFKAAEETLAGMNKTLTGLKNDYDSLERDLNDAKEKGEKVLVDWLNKASSNAKLFQKDYRDGKVDSNERIYCKEVTGGGFDSSTSLYVSFDSSSMSEGYISYSPLEFNNKYVKSTEEAPEYIYIFW